MKAWLLLLVGGAAGMALLASVPAQANTPWHVAALLLAQVEPDTAAPAAEAEPDKPDESVEEPAEEMPASDDAMESEVKPAEENAAEEMPPEETPASADGEKPAAPREPRVEPVLPTAPTEVQRLLGKPVTVEQFYRVIDRDITYGQIEDAKAHLAELLAHPELTDEACVRLQDKYGGTLPVRLMLVPELRSEGEQLGTRLQTAARKVLRDPERVRRALANLSKSAGHRSFALRQLRLAGVDAVPIVIEAIRVEDEHRADFEAALAELSPTVWPAVAAVLDTDDPQLLTVAIEALRRYGQPGAADSLWYVSAASRYPSSIRDQAVATLAALTDTPVEHLPAAAEELRAIADRHYRHEGGWGVPPETTRVWRWIDGALASSEESISAAEKYFGTRAARQALELDPSDQATLVTLLSLVLDKASEKQGIETLLAAQAPQNQAGEEKSDGANAAATDPKKPPAAAPEVSAALEAGPELLAAVLERALREGRTAVAIGAARALGATGSSQLVQPGPTGPGVLARALSYPDFRVQFAAAVSTLELRPTQRFPQAGRVVEILASALDPSTRPRAVVISSSIAEANELSYLLREIGQVPLIATSGKEGFRQASESAGVERIFAYPGFQRWDLAQTLVNLRADARTAWIPVFVFAAKEDRAQVARRTARFARVRVLPLIGDKDQLAKALELTESGWEDRPLTDGERVWLQRTALGWIHRIVRGEFPLLDPRPATEALAGLIEDPAVGSLAAETLGYLPSAAVQSRLALALEASNLPPANRVAACDGLARNIQLGGAALDNQTMEKLLSLRPADASGAEALALARLWGSIRPDLRTAARRILDYRPAPPPPPSEPAEAPAAAADSTERESPESDTDRGGEKEASEPDPR